MDDRFANLFRALTGNAPLSWQTRLYKEHFVRGDLPPVIDIPTGLGKTMVMAIWLIAREQLGNRIPTRLIYVVDRRTVVDQATDLAERLRCKFGKDKLAISTLRGQLADNREWSRDPSRPAIIIGTVDLIGSALLFSGYRSSYKRRPLEAGLLGQDSLLVLDEAHLSKPFEKLIRDIGSDGRFQKDRCEKPCGAPIKVIRMSATSKTDSDSDPFWLKGDFDARTDDFADDAIRERYGAKKHLTITPLGEKDKLTDKLASEAIKLAENNALRGTRIVVFVSKPDYATKIAEAIRKHESTKTKPGPYSDSVEVLTGTMRGLERDKLIEKPVLKRFFDGDENPYDCPNQRPVFLVSTSAGEVGFDLNADQMVCDATTIDSLIQRLGRVNRRGLGDARIHLFAEPPKKEKDGKPKKLEGLDLAIANTINVLQCIQDGDVSPKNLAALKASDAWTLKADNGKSAYENACSPEPTTVPLTDILLDAWSMTSITAPMPGRPAVGPWLRGIADELPQTTIAWRAELDLEGFEQFDLQEIEEWFDTHRILTHETLSVPTSFAAKWFLDRWDKLDGNQKSDVGKRLIVVDRAGLKRVTVADVINQLDRKNMESIRNADLILPASFGGIERGIGLLDAAAPRKPEDAKDADEQTRHANANLRLVAPDVADAVKELPRQREIVAKTEDGEPERRIIGGGTKPGKPARFVVELASDDEQTVRLVSYVSRREKLEWGTDKTIPA